MNGSQGKGSEERGVRFVPMQGSVVGGVPKDKTVRLTDAMADLKLGIDGLKSQLHDVSDGNRWAHALGPFARICSVFLRKAVLGDHDKRETRLLDDRVLESIGLRLDPLRKIPKDGRREIEVGIQTFLLEGPNAHGSSTPLWSCPRVARLIEDRFGVCYHECHVWKLLRALNWSPQRPVGKARERNKEAICTWRKKPWPTLKKPRKQGPTIVFIDESGLSQRPHAHRVGSLTGSSQRPGARVSRLLRRLHRHRVPAHPRSTRLNTSGATGSSTSCRTSVPRTTGNSTRVLGRPYAVCSSHASSPLSGNSLLCP